jgi:hypothetical protein
VSLTRLDAASHNAQIPDLAADLALTCPRSRYHRSRRRALIYTARPLLLSPCTLVLSLFRASRAVVGALLRPPLHRLLHRAPPWARPSAAPAAPPSAAPPQHQPPLLWLAGCLSTASPALRGTNRPSFSSPAARSRHRPSLLRLAGCP